MTTALLQLAKTLGDTLNQQQQTLCTAESCTGGLIAATLTAIPGSSAWFECAFVTYSNQAKEQMLRVSHQHLKQFGAVSGETVRDMALGALAAAKTNYAIAVTGIAGPSGGTAQKPVGLVWIAYAKQNNPAIVLTRECHFTGDRQQIREQTVQTALQDLMYWLNHPNIQTVPNYSV